MIDFITKKDSKTLFINTTRNNNSNTCAIYDDIVIDFVRELSASEIGLVRKNYADKDKVRQLLEEKELKEY